MSRTPTGSVSRRGKKVFARITLPGGTRKRLVLPDGLKPQDIKDLTRATSQQIRLEMLTSQQAPPKPKRYDPDAKPERGSLKEWSLAWVEFRKGRGMPCVKDDLSKLRTHIWPVLGNKPMATFSIEDLERFVEHLDDRVVKGEIAAKTAQNIWSVISTMCTAATKSKNRDLRVRRDNPARDVAPPDDGPKKALVYLYPSEFDRLVRCDRVPMRWRRLFALAVYTFCRAGELEALRPEDVDLEHMVLHVHSSIDRYRQIGKRKTTKSGVARRIEIEPGLVPLLRQLLAEAPAGGPLVKMPPAEDLPPRLRQYLAWAGVTRSDLHETDATRRRIVFHDLRATGITWCAIRGDEPLRIQQRAGHEHFETTQKYIREAVAHRIGFGVPFAKLPDDLAQPIGPSPEKKR